MSYSVEIKGLAEMKANLQKIDSDLRGQVAREAVHAGASVIMSRAVINAPVKTAALRNSFRVESRATGSGAEAEVGPHVIYGRIQELGGYAGRGHRTKIKGKFYLSHAIDEKSAEAASEMAETIRDYLR